MNEYVVGFVFNETMNSVLLIRKNHPEWQSGLLNGIGGKIEEGETPVQAMSREFVEEAGVFVSEDGWRPLGILGSDDFVVHCFSLISQSAFKSARTTSDEELEWWTVGAPELEIESVPSVPLLLLLAKDSNFLKGQLTVVASYMNLNGD